MIIRNDSELPKEDIEKLLNESKTLTYLKFCTKACPSCNNSIQKTEGCNKMICSACQTKFCWMCLAVLPILDPYSHFKV